MRFKFEVYRFFMPMFLHANFNHILSNSIGFFIFGSLMETILGSTKFLMVYFVTGINGILFSSLITDNVGVGASAAIFG